ncbi:MAG: hypothetical protein ABIT71_10035 [Vicinamibacteraceae bacterium]
MVILTARDIEGHRAGIRQAAEKTQAWLAAQAGDPLELLRRMKFEEVGCHPVGGCALNIIEQVNQTWTYAVALEATRLLLDLHPGVGGFTLAPGASASQPLDIMSVSKGFVGAETFAAVHPSNNGKLAKDLDKLAVRTETYRYVFFSSPRFPGVKRLPKLERDGIQVWSVDV